MTIRTLGSQGLVVSELGLGCMGMRVEAIAAEKEITPSQLALAWVLSRGDDVVPIPGTKRRRYLEENAAAADIELTAAEIDEIESAFPKGASSGDRYADMSPVGH